jgi:predicted ester cyclase
MIRKEKEHTTMSTSENKELVRRYFDERWNHGNPDICDELLDPRSDIAGTKEWMRSIYATFGNIELTILDLLAEDDQVAIHWRVAATHQGEYLGVAATGKPVTYQGMALLRVVNGKIVDDVAYWDDLAILQQLDAAPLAGQA